MQPIVKKQIEQMTEEELRDVLRRDHLRRLTRYRMTDDFYRKKYGTTFEEFERSNIVEKQNYSFEVESDAQEWELAIDGIKTVEQKLKELSGGN